MDISWGK